MQSSTVDFIYDYYSIEGSESNRLSNTNASSVNMPNTPPTGTNPKPKLAINIENQPTQNGMVSKVSISGGGLTREIYSINGKPFGVPQTIASPVEPLKSVPK